MLLKIIFFKLAVATTTNSKGGSSSENLAKPWLRLPQKVQASFADSMKEMISTGQGTLAVSWPYSETIYDPYRIYTCYSQFANLKLIVEITENTRFAEVERRVDQPALSGSN